MIDVIFLISRAGILSDRKERYLLSGDLSSMAAQANLLRSNGFDIFFHDVYPCLGTMEEFNRAAKLIVEKKVQGYHHYEEHVKKVAEEEVQKKDVAGELSDEKTKKWVLQIGCHNGTITSRDSTSRMHGSFEECKADFEETKKLWDSFRNTFVWFAYAKGPDGENIKLCEGAHYRS